MFKQGMLCAWLGGASSAQAHPAREDGASSIIADVGRFVKREMGETALTKTPLLAYTIT